GADRLIIDTGGNVGIGTTTPQGTLHVSSSDTKPAGSYWKTIIQDTTAPATGVGGGIQFAGYKNTPSSLEFFAAIDGYKENAILGNAAGAFRILTQPSTGLGLVERVRVDSTGNVGIGTTSPATTLDVKGKANFTGNFSIGQTSNIFFVDNTSGNVGINNSNPTQTLSIVGNVCLDDASGTACSSRTIPMGAMEADGTISGSAFDLAERFYTADESIEAGDVVIVSEVKYEEYLAASVLDVKEDQLKELMQRLNSKDPEALSEQLEEIADAYALNIQVPSKITGNVINEVGLETDLSQILEETPAQTEEQGLNEQQPVQEEAVNEISAPIEAQNEITSQAPSEITEEFTSAFEEKLKEKIIKKLKSKDTYIGGSTGKDKLLSSKVAIISKTETENDPRIVGVVSSDPSFIMGSASDHTSGRNVPVALVGRAPVKVSLENGPIKAGDPLTSSAAEGYAVKSISSGKIIGYALEDYSKETKNGKILIMMQPGWYTAPGEAQGSQASQNKNDYISKVNGSVIIRIG
ncbi:MAG: hypothetical protein AABX00_03020, partial [Nanoarchaeota archaeon]